MGPAPYRFTHENIEASRCAVIGGFGYCDYRELNLFHDTLILKNEYNNTILFLSSNHSSYITGATIVADGGRSII